MKSSSKVAAVFAAVLLAVTVIGCSSPSSGSSGASGVDKFKGTKWQGKDTYGRTWTCEFFDNYEVQVEYDYGEINPKIEVERSHSQYIPSYYNDDNKCRIFDHGYGYTILIIDSNDSDKAKFEADNWTFSKVK